MKYEPKYPIEKLKEYKDNPRQNNKAVDKLKPLIEKYGFINPIIADQNGIIRAGHTRIKSAKKIGYKEVPVLFVDFKTEAEAKGFALADNKSNEFSDWDTDLLAQEFYDLEDTDAFNFTGFTNEEISQIWDGDVEVKKTDFSKKEIKLVFQNSEKMKEVYEKIEPILEKYSVDIKMDKELKEHLGLD